MRHYFKTYFLILLLVAWAGWALSACDEPPAPTNTPNALPPTDHIPEVFKRAWKACGGIAGAGRWVYGPAWYQGSLVGVAEHMIFVWRAGAPRYGPHPFPTFKPPPNNTQPQVPNFFTRWINHHGGYQCSGSPLAPPVQKEDENTICQDFTILTLCSDPQGQKVWATNRGSNFYQRYSKELLPRLPTTLPAQKGWSTQVNLTLSADQQNVAIIARAAFKGSAPSSRPLTLAVQLNDSQLGPIYFHLEEMPPNGIWKHTVRLPQLGKGNHTLVVQTCTVAAKAWQACDEDVVQLRVVP